MNERDTGLPTKDETSDSTVRNLCSLNYFIYGFLQLFALISLCAKLISLSAINYKKAESQVYSSPIVIFKEQQVVNKGSSFEDNPVVELETVGSSRPCS